MTTHRVETARRLDSRDTARARGCDASTPPSALVSSRERSEGIRAVRGLIAATLFALAAWAAIGIGVWATIVLVQSH